MTHKNLAYCDAAIRVAHLILDEGKIVFSLDEGKQAAGIYWLSLVKEMTKAGVGPNNQGRFRVRIPELITPILADAKANREKLLKEESDRRLDRRYKLKGIWYGRWSLFISLLAFLLSLWSLYKQGIISF